MANRWFDADHRETLRATASVKPHDIMSLYLCNNYKTIQYIYIYLLI